MGTAKEILRRKRKGVRGAPMEKKIAQNWIDVRIDGSDSDIVVSVR